MISTGYYVYIPVALQHEFYCSVLAFMTVKHSGHSSGVYTGNHQVIEPVIQYPAQTHPSFQSARGHQLTSKAVVHHQFGLYSLQ